MNDALKALIPLLEQEASTRNAEYTAAHERMRQAHEECQAALERSLETDKLLDHIRDFLNGVSTEVSL